MSSNKIMFQKLTPIQDTDMNTYKEALDFVFENDDIKNVAISGAYSAGKSSVIETYKKGHTEKRFLHISLAHFESAEHLGKEEQLNQINSSKKRNTTETQEIILENVLEGKILNQLLHQIDEKNIPQTNFGIKRTVSKKTSLWHTLIFLTLCIAVAYIWKFKEWKEYVENLSAFKPLLEWTQNSAVLLFSAVIITIILGYYIFALIQIQKNKNLFKRVSVKGNEIEIFEQSSDSYFDRYLNDVLYLFENSGVDVVVFEDMDRYNANQIFQRLREINILVNNRRGEQKKAPIRFFYLLRDDIFVSKDRTKFFDFIIPIVPILDGSNSYDQLISHFKQGEILELFEENFLQGISLYVDDMRILKNVYNEFMIYNARIGTTEQNANKLLALIVYKNLFPRDFSDLQLNKGFVALLFASKEQFVKQKKSALQSKIVALREEISNIENEVLKSDAEIDLIYSKAPYVDRWGTFLNKYAGEKATRKELLKLREDGQVEKNNAEIKKCEEQIIKLNNLKLCEIIDRENIESIFAISHKNLIGDINNFKEIKSNEYFDLLKFLIRNGYIDETYPDYMTYFYENSLPRTDKMFLRSVTDQKAKEYSYHIQNPHMVLSRLRIVDFEKEEVLNFDLLSYMLSKNATYTEQLKQLVLQLQDSGGYDFILQYLKSGVEVERFVQVINRHWVQFFESILIEPRFTEEDRKMIAQLSLCASSKEELATINKQNIFSNYVAQMDDFLQFSEPRIEELVEKMKHLQVRFANIDYSISNPELWNEVYSNNLYELNWEMIESILENQYSIQKSDEYKHKNLTLILSEPQEPLALYVKNNMNAYFEIMLEQCEDKIDDSEEVVEFVLNDDSLDEGHKILYNDKITTKITSLATIDDSIWWQRLIVKEHLLYTEENVLRYYFEYNKYDSCLIDFINKYGDRFFINIEKIDELFGKDKSKEFFAATVKCNALENEKYERILGALKYVYNSFSFDSIDSDKIEILIQLGIITMTSDNLDFMRNTYPHLVLNFIENNSKKYVEEILDAEHFLLEEMLDVLNSNIEEEYKIKLLEFTDEPISIIDKQYNIKVMEYILRNNFDTNDLQYLLKNYENLVPSTKEIIELLGKQYVDDIISNEYMLAYALLIRMLGDKTISYPKRFEIFSFSVMDLNKEQCKDCLEILTAKEYLGVFVGKRPKISISEASERILDVFQRRGWISKYEVYKEKYYRVIGRGTQSKNKIPVELL